MKIEIELSEQLGNNCIYKVSYTDADGNTIITGIRSDTMIEVHESEVPQQVLDFAIAWIKEEF